MLKKDNLPLGGSSPIQILNRFMTTPGYIMLIMALTAISNLFGAELIS